MWGHLWASFGICGESSLWRSKKVVLSFPLGLGRSKLFSNLHTSTGTSDSKGAFDYSSRCMWRAVIPWDLPGAAWICATIRQVIVISPLLAQLALLCLALHDTLFIDSWELFFFILDVYLSTTLEWCYGNAKGDGDHSNSLEYMKILLEPLCASDLSQPSHAPTFINSAFFHDFSHSTRYHIVPLLDSTSMTCKGVVNSLQASSISSSEVNLGVLQTPESFIFVFIIFPNTYLLLLQAMLYVNIHHYKGLWVKLLLSIVLCLTLLMMLCRRT